MENIEKVNEQIAFLTKGMTPSEPASQYGATVTTYAKPGDTEPALEITVYEPGTPIDSEHAGLLEEAPDMTKLLHGDVEDITTTRVVVLDLADGVDSGPSDELQTEAERNGTIEGRDASTHPFDGVVSDTVVEPGIDLSKAVLSTYDATRAEVDAVYAKGGMPTEAQIEALDPLGQEEDDEGACAI